MSEELKEKFASLKEDAGELFSAIKGAVAEKAGDIKEDTKELFTEIKNEGTKTLKEDILPGASKAMQEAKSYVKEKIQDIKEDGLFDKDENKENKENAPALDPAAQALQEARAKVAEQINKENE